jgi:hypothetical protein
MGARARALAPPPPACSARTTGCRTACAACRASRADAQPRSNALQGPGCVPGPCELSSTARAARRGVGVEEHV